MSKVGLLYGYLQRTNFDVSATSIDRMDGYMALAHEIHKLTHEEEKTAISP